MARHTLLVSGSRIALLLANHDPLPDNLLLLCEHFPALPFRQYQRLVSAVRNVSNGVPSTLFLTNFPQNSMKPTVALRLGCGRWHEIALVTSMQGFENDFP
jgi:hypothetical protein